MTQVLSSDGSAINNVIKEITREGAKSGIESAVLGSDKRDYHFPHARLLPVNYSAYVGREYLTRREIITDTALGRLQVPRSYLTRLFRPSAEVLMSEQSDGPVFVHDGFYGAYALKTLKRYSPKRPLFLYVHNNLSRSYSRRELSRVLSYADRVICVSDAMCQHVRDRAGRALPDERLVTVLNGIDTGLFHPSASPGNGPQRILFAGQMAPHKGPHLIIEALKRLPRRDFQLTFIGSSTHRVNMPISPYERRLRNDANSLQPRVAFVPYVPHPEVPSRYREHDILVVPSQFDDPCPLVLLEGMASGLAVVCSGRGGMREVGADAVQYASTPDQLAQVLDDLLGNRASRQEWGRRARERAEQLSWQVAFMALRHVVETTV
jgi:glycosyltransferase involved in cell wall biosynthesis